MTFLLRMIGGGVFALAFLVAACDEPAMPAVDSHGSVPGLGELCDPFESDDSAEFPPCPSFLTCIADPIRGGVCAWRSCYDNSDCPPRSTCNAGGTCLPAGIWPGELAPCDSRNTESCPRYLQCEDPDRDGFGLCGRRECYSNRDCVGAVDGLGQSMPVCRDGHCGARGCQ